MINTLNAVLCAAIFALGIWGYGRLRDTFLLSVAIAFGLFGVSHVISIVGLDASMQNTFVIVRIVAYLAVVLGLFRKVAEKK